jgi:predicted TIM-barrel fold metal-dependent hydrolase
LKEFVPISQVLFGSDFPYIGPAVLQAERYGLENSKVLDDAARAAIDRGNALTLSRGSRSHQTEPRRRPERQGLGV